MNYIVKWRVARYPLILIFNSDQPPDSDFRNCCRTSQSRDLYPRPRIVMVQPECNKPCHLKAIAAAITVFVLYDNMRSLGEEKVTRGYFLSEPQLGHQKILVPIELRQVRDMSDDETENASIGVQTSGTRTQQV
nr:Protein H12D21.9 [Haemonchus contortus]